MTNILLPYLVPMLLGRTIDLRSYTVGGSIYDYANYVETPIGTMNTSYHVLQDDSLPYSEFGLPIDVALRIKAGLLSTSSGAMGLNGLLKDTSWKYNSVVVAATSFYRTVDRSIKKDTEVLTDWKEKIPWTQTHYADKMMYGAICTVLFRFKCDIPGDMQAVRHTVTQNLGTSGQLGDNIGDLWKKTVEAVQANKDVRGKVKISTSLFSSVPIETFIDSPEKYKQALEEMKKTVQSPGQALFMNLRPIHDIDQGYEEVKVDSALVGDLEKIDDMYDDLKVTKESLVRWTTDTTALFSDEDEQRIYSLLEKINSGIRTFRRVNEDVSLYKKMDRSSIDLAFHQYQNGLEQGMGTYNLAYLKLREEIDAECDDTFLYKIKGLLKVYAKEVEKKGKVEGGLQECQKYCTQNDKCRAVGYADSIAAMDLNTGLFTKEEKQCWVYFRSTNTAIVYTPTELNGDMGIYDRKCYIE